MNDACKDKSLNLHSAGWVWIRSNSAKAKRAILFEGRRRPLKRSFGSWVSNGWTFSKLWSAWLGLRAAIWLISFISTYCGCQSGSWLPALFADMCELIAPFCSEMLLAVETVGLQGGSLAPVQHLDCFWYLSWLYTEIHCCTLVCYSRVPFWLFLPYKAIFQPSMSHGYFFIFMWNNCLCLYLYASNK